MPDLFLTWSNRRDSRCLPNSYSFRDFQKFSTCSAAWTPATWTARRSSNSSAWGSAGPVDHGQRKVLPNPVATEEFITRIVSLKTHRQAEPKPGRFSFSRGAAGGLCCSYRRDMRAADRLDIASVDAPRSRDYYPVALHVDTRRYRADSKRCLRL